ncbi:hypothetical protein Tco_0248426 [Tanacetum coccineum]
MQTTEEKVDTSKSIGCNIRPIYDEEPIVEVQTTAEINVFATRQQHIEQHEFNNEGEVDQNVEQCHDTCSLPTKLTDNQTPELSNQSLMSENICLKKTVAQFQKDFSRMEAHCVNLELKYQNQVLKEGQHGQFSKVKSNEAKVKHDIDVIETINIELKHKVAILLKENETLKRHYKEINNSARLSNKFGRFYFSFKFGISGLLHHVVTAIADRIRGCQESNGSFGFQYLCLRQELLEYMDVHDKDASESSQPSWGKMCTSET